MGDQSMSSVDLAPKIGAIMGGPDSEAVSQAISRVSRALKAMAGRSYGVGVSFFGICFEVGGSLLTVNYAGARTCRLMKDGHLSCSLGIPEHLWAELSDREVVQLVAKMTGEAIAAMVKHVVKRAPGFDGAAYLSDALAILDSIDDAPLPTTESVVHRALKAIIASEGGNSLPIGPCMSVSIDPESDSGLRFTRTADLLPREENTTDSVDIN